jgi:hypothetical protein
MYFKDPDSVGADHQELGTGTGFIREISDRCFLITARHNLNGRHPDTGRPISSTGGIPNQIELDGFHIRANLALYHSANNPNDSEHCPPLQIQRLTLLFFHLQHPVTNTLLGMRDFSTRCKIKDSLLFEPLRPASW